MEEDIIFLKDLRLGKTDAKNELLEGTQEEKQFFENSFLMPENVSIDDFSDKNVFFVTGMKGSGKTALLRYIELEIKKIYPNSTTSFILFKSDIDEENRDKFTIASNSFIVNKESLDEKEFNRYEGVWEWFFYRQIVRLSLDGAYYIFKRDNNWNDFLETIQLPKESDSEGWFSKLGIKIKHGNVEVKAASEHLSLSLGLDFDVDSKERSIAFSKLLSKARELFNHLTPTNYPLFFFVDELEITLSTNKQYKRDIQLVRDLILACSKLNRRCIQLKYPIKIIAGIRNEVLSAIENIGHEINKEIADFGRPLVWQRAGNDYPNHPLMHLLVKRIQASEEALGIQPTEAEEVWNKYFTSEVNRIPIQKYLIEQTWERPRDIIRLLDISKKLFGNQQKFTQAVFEGIGKEYAKESWIEITEELSATYKPNEVKGIKELLMGISSPFNFAEIKSISEQKREYSKELDELLKKEKLADILRKLYEVGIIGNDGHRVRFSFRGDEGLLLEQDMKVVNPLWKYLSISKTRR